MTRKRIGLVAVVAAVLAVGGLLGGVLADGDPSDAAPPRSGEAVAEQALDGFSSGDTESIVRELQSQLRESPDNAQALTLLGLAYQQRARETGDPTYYSKSEEVLDEALELDPKQLFATSGLGSLALARHEFAEALELGERAKELSPTTARNYGVIGDALIELGRYEEAIEAFDRMVALKPNLAAYSRVSYARELLGDREGAIEAMELALDAARGSREPRAWTEVELGKLHFAAGRLDEAERYYRAALESFPSFVPALGALALVEAAQGRYDEAIQLTTRAVERNPLPQLVVQLEDLYEATGQTELAKQQEQLIEAINKLLVANGSKVDLETAVYYADHDIRLDAAVELARRARADRPGIYGDDALAWALARNGRCEEALPYAKQALRLGTLDASLYFHRGYVAQCLGRAGEAERWFTRALELNPNFSVRWAPYVRDAIEEAVA
jgi:tetratricopeptide (TPR) repeat protein